MSTRLTLSLNDGTLVPSLAFGTGSALFSKDATEYVRMAIENGITHLDGAQLYNNEQTLGAGIRASGKPRSDLYIVTKLKTPEPGQTVKGMLSESLTKLGMEDVDLFLIHSPVWGRERGNLKKVWKEMEEVKKEGLTKSIGVSNFNEDDLRVILDGAEVIPAVNQIELHPYVWKASRGVVDFCKKHGIVIASYGGQTPFARAPASEGTLPLNYVLSAIRERLEKTRGQTVTLGQVLTKWLLQKGTIVVTTSSKASRMKEFLDTEEVPELTIAEIQAIEDAGSKMHKRHYWPNEIKDGE